MPASSDNLYLRSREEEPQEVRRPYRKPRLEVLGDVRGRTLGGTVVDVGDSQFPNTRP